MSSTGTVPASNIVRLQRSLEFLSGSFLTERGLGPLGLDIDVAAPRSQPLVAALARNEPFPLTEFENGNIDITNLAASLGTPVRLGPASGEVSFGATVRLGVYSDAPAAHKALGFDGRVSGALPGALAADSCYSLALFGYDVNAAAQGSVALSVGGSVTFGAEAARSANYAVVRRIAKTSKSRDALASTFESWMLPSQVQGIEQLTEKRLAPGTWILAEVDGSIALKVGAQLGYDVNWIRKTSLGQLQGDLGVKVQAAVSATLGFSASGRYLVVLGREGDAENVRLAVLKERKKGWDFALNAGVTLQAQLPVARNTKLLDFVAAVVGTSGAQLIEDLKEIRLWTDPGTRLSDRLAGFLIDLGKKQLDAAGLPVEEILAKAHAQVTQFLDQWERLPDQGSVALWSVIRDLAGDDAAVDAFRDWLDAVATGGDLRAAIGEELARIDFFQTPRGRWLEAVAVPGVVAVLNNNELAKQVREAAAAARDILNGGVLRQLQIFVNERIDLEKIKDATDPEQIDAWAKSKLAALLEKPLDAAALTEARQAINTLFEKAEEIWQASLKAATAKYNFSLSAGYQKTTAQGALIDVEIDLTGGDADAAALLRAAIQGDFERVLLEQNDRVRLLEGELTHNVKRQSFVEVTLPWTQSKTTHLNDTLAKLRAINDGGRVLVYQLDSKDQVTEVTKGKSARDSRLIVGAKLASEAGGAVRQFSKGSYSWSYLLRQGIREMRKSHARMQLGGYASVYFPRQFSAGGAESLETWVDDLDRFIDAKEDNGSNNFGNTYLELEVSAPGESVEAWFNAPADAKDRAYLAMSRRIQESLKRLVTLYYLSDPSLYKKDLLVIRPLLVYAAIPASTDIEMKSDDRLAGINAAKDVYWDVSDLKKIRAMATSARTITNLQTRMATVAAILREIRDLASSAGDYDPNPINIDNVLKTALQPTSPAIARPALLGSLLTFELTVVRGAVGAGLKIAEFRKAAGTKDLNKALDTLEQFGSKLTETFHKNIAPIYGGGAVRALGTMVFLEAALALAGSGTAFAPSAMMTLSVFPKSWAGFDPETLASDGIPDDAPMPVAAQRLVQFAGA